MKEQWTTEHEQHIAQMPEIKSDAERVRQEFEALKEAILQRSLDTHFSFEKLDDQAAEQARATYELLITHADGAIGSGNNAIVYNAFDPRKYHQEADHGVCAKMRWEDLLVSTRLQGTTRKEYIPQDIERRIGIQNYFETIRRKRGELIRKGYSFETQNGSLEEAAMTQAVDLALAAHSIHNATPQLLEFLSIEHEEEGEPTAKKQPTYMLHEKVFLFYIDRIYGKNIQEIILDPVSSFVERRQEIDVDAIEKRLYEILDALHAEGIFHKDISLRNIMLDEQTLTPRLIDFGTTTFETGSKAEKAKESDRKGVDEMCKQLRAWQQNPEKQRQTLEERLRSND
jgi:serine/threonine protein kinase